MNLVVGARRASPERRASPDLNETGQARLTPTKLGTIGDTDMPIWQRNYYEHIIRNERDLERNWHGDEYNPENIK